MLRVIMLSVIMLSVIMLSVIMLREASRTQDLRNSSVSTVTSVAANEN